jgi:hypothetical protein
MSTKAGPKNYTVYVTDISGSAQSGVNSGWLITGRVNSELITTGTVEEIGNGFYFAVIDAPNGTGFVKVSNSDNSFIITPSYFIIDDNENDTDDLYAQQSIISANVDTVKTIVSNLRFSSQEASRCSCLGPPSAPQPPFFADRLSAMVYPKFLITDYKGR